MNKPVAIPDERDLLRRLRSGDEWAFEQLYKLYSLRIYRKLRKMVKVDVVADELMQDVFVKVWDKRRLVDPERSFRSYLFRISERLVYDFYRKAARDERLQEVVISISAESYTHTEEELFFKESQAILHQAIETLPLQQRRVFMLCKLEGKTYEEVGQILNISPSTISNHIVKATKAVRKYVFNSQKIALALVAAAIFS